MARSIGELRFSGVGNIMYKNIRISCRAKVWLAGVVLALFAVGDVSAATTWTVSSGPTFGQKPFGSGTFSAVSWAGKIDPPLAGGMVAHICEVELTGCSGAGVGTSVSLSSGDYQGGANGASFTVDIKQGVLSKVCPSIKVTYCLLNSSNKVCVTLVNPAYIQGGKVSFSGAVPGALPTGSTIAANLQILGRNGELNTSYNGFVEVTVSAIGESVVLLEDSHGTMMVEIVDGEGVFQIDSTEATSGDTVYFTVVGSRLDTTRTSFEVP